MTNMLSTESCSSSRLRSVYLWISRLVQRVDLLTGVNLWLLSASSKPGEADKYRIPLQILKVKCLCPGADEIITVTKIQRQMEKDRIGFNDLLQVFLGLKPGNGVLSRLCRIMRLFSKIYLGMGMTLNNCVSMSSLTWATLDNAYSVAFWISMPRICG